jgi:hypothetical protein
MWDPIPLHYWAEGEWHCLAFGTDPLLGAIVQRRVPTSHLEHDVRRRLWRIRGAYWPALVETLCDELGFGSLISYDGESQYREKDLTDTTPAFGRADSTDYAVLHLLPTAPLEVIQASYTALAKVLHPDGGGRTRAMARLNQAHDAIVRRPRLVAGSRG